ncbi:cation diffusion facilitator family transporter [Exiguobacterium sp. N4-1P]|uniref:cation diffusion facilitator family transporter n=1 Tax=Exiguobacterium sp. N4-1P TaxID=2051906 RepID=UPI000B58808A|nr:cation diffusion facilitator family transporter [Exiguobacterium sp. N4-1P]ASI35012.1 cation diffusion facilitator family transporter [Exiguobacterium sp. N4-1P]
MGEFITLLRRGNRSALTAGIVNSIIAIIKTIAYTLTGNVAMFAEMMHSLGDAANQFFVFIGSALSKKAPTKRFPNGFGRLVNLVLLGAILFVGIMAYETIHEGIGHIIDPTESTGFWITLSVLFAGVVLESAVFFKAMKEIAHDAKLTAKGPRLILESFRSLKQAKPATRLVFLEYLVATAGGIVAMIAVVISHVTPYHQAEGIASVLIGLMMFYVVGNVFLQNAAGALGEADETMAARLGGLIMQDPDVRDISKLEVIKEGDHFHVEVEIEIDPAMTVAQADDIKDRLELQLRIQQDITDVTIGFDEDDQVQQYIVSTNEER